jgi:phospholipase C
MSTCTKWVNTLVISCKDWSAQLDYTCTTWADEGSDQCSQWADEGSSQCTSWEKCHWYTPWDCIAGFFCRAYYWVANWVCQAWYWLAKWVCKAFAWVVNTVCVLFSWVLQLVCVAWDTIRCALLALLKLLAGLRGRGRGKPAPAKIQHVFVLTLENRAFDHMLAFSGITGVDPAGNPTVFNAGFDPVLSSNIDPTTLATVPASTPADFALEGIDKDPGHEFENTLVALCGNDAVYNPVLGGYPTIDNSGFIQNYLDGGSATPDRIMHCYDPRQLPVINALAREFAVCDQYFSSLPGPTWPNRFFQLAATSGGLDGSPSPLDVVTSTTVAGYAFQNGNIFDLLDANCIDWTIFEGDDFPVSFALEGMNLNLLQGRFKGFDDFAAELNKPSFGTPFVFIEPKYGAKEFDATGPGDFSCGNSMHPLDDVTRGEALIKQVYEAIRNSPHWEHSLLIVTFDEHGGFYDHVAPGPAVPPGDLETTRYIQHNFKFDQLGVRVPALVISPYIARGVIDHTLYDHTSMLATVERLFGIGNLTNRDKAANDMLGLLTLDDPRGDSPTTLPPVAVNPDPLNCGDGNESVDVLLARRSELRLARESGIYRGREVARSLVPSTRVGFLQVALLKALVGTTPPDRGQWIADYTAMETDLDAAIFMAEAKLKLRHGIDIKKTEREGRREAARARRYLKK